MRHSEAMEIVHSLAWAALDEETAPYDAERARRSEAVATLGGIVVDMADAIDARFPVPETPAEDPEDTSSPTEADDPWSASGSLRICLRMARALELHEDEAAQFAQAAPLAERFLAAEGPELDTMCWRSVHLPPGLLG